LICGAASCPVDIRKECTRRLDEVSTNLPTILFVVKDPLGNDLSAVRVTMDQELLAERLEGTALPVDPGVHTFTFETAGQPAVTKQLLIQQGQRDRQELVTLGSSPPPLSAPPPPPPRQEGQPSHAGAWGTQRILAIVAEGIGVVGLGVGSAFGVMALSKKSAAQSVCPGAGCPTQAGANDWSDAKTEAQISDALFLVGGLGIAGGAVLWFTAPRSAGPDTQVGLGPSGMQLKGVW
jgi:hypothetical protein